MKRAYTIIYSIAAITGCLLALTFTACKKSSAGNTKTGGSTTPVDTVNVITATINDTNYIFNIGPLDTAFLKGTATIREVAAWDSDIGNSNTVKIDFQTPAKVATTLGTYDEIGSMHAALYFATQGATIYFQDINSKSDKNPVTATITEITDSSIRGTFQGDIYFNGDKTQFKETVTGGKFNFRK